jgi:hypothetical protein
MLQVIEMILTSWSVYFRVATFQRFLHVVGTSIPQRRVCQRYAISRRKSKSLTLGFAKQSNAVIAPLKQCTGFGWLQTREQRNSKNCTQT